MPRPEIPNKSTTVRVFGWTLQALAIAAPPLAARLAWHLFTRAPARLAMTEREAARMAEADRLAVSVHGNELAVYAWGEGPVVMLVHGWGGRAAQLTPFVRPLTDAGYRVVAFDGPGHGMTPGHRASVIAFADAVRAVARHVGPTHATIAHSMGAASTVRALSQGASVGGLALVAPAAEPKAYFEWFARYMGLTREQIADVRDRIERRAGLSFADLDVVPKMAERDHPVFVVHDVGDRETPFDGGKAIAQASTRGVLHPTRGLGHRRILADDQVLQSVCTFVRTLGAGAHARSDTDHELGRALAFGRS